MRPNLPPEPPPFDVDFAAAVLGVAAAAAEVDAVAAAGVAASASGAVAALEAAVLGAGTEAVGPASGGRLSSALHALVNTAWITASVGSRPAASAA